MHALPTGMWANCKRCIPVVKTIHIKDFNVFTRGNDIALFHLHRVIVISEKPVEEL